MPVQCFTDLLSYQANWGHYVGQNEINQISFELRMEAILMLMIVAVLLM